MPTAVTENRSIPRRHEISVTKDKKRPQILSEQKGGKKKRLGIRMAMDLSKAMLKQ